MPTEQTATVTVIRPPLEHFVACDRDVLGRAVMALMDGPAEDITARNLRAWARGYRQTARCDCLALKIKSLESALTSARKAFEACATDDNAERVAHVKAELARLRGMQ